MLHRAVASFVFITGLEIASKISISTLVKKLILYTPVGQTIPKPEILAPKSKPEDCNKPKRHKVRFSSAPKYGVGTPHKVLMIIVEKVLILLIPDNNVSSMKIF